VRRSNLAAWLGGDAPGVPLLPLTGRARVVVAPPTLSRLCGGLPVADHGDHGWAAGLLLNRRKIPALPPGKWHAASAAFSACEPSQRGRFAVASD
jgi:hypothetical protein